jgi:dihydroxy-acid dehydratase
MDIPAICMVCQARSSHVRADEVSQNVGPMLNGYAGSKYVGSGMVVWDSRAQLSAGEIDQDQFMRQVSLSAPR